MTAEQERWHGGSRAELIRRFNELASKRVLARTRLASTLALWQSKPESNEAFSAYFESVQYAVKTNVDSLWIGSLMEARLSEKVILDLWDKKEKNEGLVRDILSES